MVTKVKGRPYFFVIITRLPSRTICNKCLVNKQPKTEDKSKSDIATCSYIFGVVELTISTDSILVVLWTLSYCVEKVSHYISPLRRINWA